MRPILLLHGALGSQSQLHPLKSVLVAQGRQVYSTNFSGHSGKPFATTFGIETFSEDVSRFLQENNIKKTDIFGYSMGGYVALWLAHTHPDCVGEIVTLGTKFDWSRESAAKELKKLDPDKIAEKVPAFARILQHRHAPHDWRALLRQTSNMMTELGNEPLLTTEILRTIPHFTSILLGNQDDMADREYSEKVATFLPQGHFHLLQDTPHPIERVNLTRLLNFIKH